MKVKITANSLVLMVLVLLLPLQALADFNSGSDGSDGALLVSYDAESETNVVMANGVFVGSELPLPEDGVFNFTSVTIETGATLTFIKNDDNSPVTFLTTGDVRIDGTLNLNGQAGSGTLSPGAGGPGGYDGGLGGVNSQNGRRGEGPGGGGGGAGGAIRIVCNLLSGDGTINA